MTENTFGIHTSNSDNPQLFTDQLLPLCSVVKVLVNFNDFGKLLDFRTKAPAYATFVGRYIAQDLDGHELHNRYKALGNDTEAYALGIWYADRIAEQAIPRGLTWLYWEAGPNEINDVSTRNSSYNLGFIHRMTGHGLRVALGNQSYGRPKIQPLDQIDEWLNWRPVFQAMDAVNRDSAGNPLSQPRAVLQLHEYIKYCSVGNSIPHAFCRYRLVYDRHILPYNLWIPLVLGELGYATDEPWLGDGVPPTEEVLRQIPQCCEEMAKDPYVIGGAWWDWRGASAGELGSDWSYCANDIIRVLREKNYTPRHITPPGAPIPVPPEPEPPTPDPEPGEYRTTDYLNMRTIPGITNNNKISGSPLPPNTRVTVLELSGDWARIEYNSEVWVHTNWLEEI